MNLIDLIHFSMTIARPVQEIKLICFDGHHNRNINYKKCVL